MLHAQTWFANILVVNNVLTLSTVMLSLIIFFIAFWHLYFYYSINKKFIFLLEFSGDVFVLYGVTDAANEGTWVCEGTGQTIATATGPGTGGPLFHSSQPDGDQDCGFGRGAKDFLLGDLSCTHSSHYFLCEKP